MARFRAVVEVETSMIDVVEAEGPGAARALVDGNRAMILAGRCTLRVRPLDGED